MATLAAINKQIALLQKQADALRKSESKAAAAKARELIELFDLTPEDVGFGKALARKSQDLAKAESGAQGKPRAAKAKKSAGGRPIGIPKFRDPASGKTWTGVGKAPRWISGVADRTPFLIETQVAAAAAAELPAAKVAKPAKALKTAKAAKPVKAAPKSEAKAPAPGKAPVKTPAKAPAKSPAKAVKAVKAPKPAKAAADPKPAPAPAPAPAEGAAEA